MQALFSLPVLFMIGLLMAGSLVFVVGALLWLKRLRHHLAHSLGDALSRQIQHGQKVEEALQVLQRNQKQLESQLQTLTHAHARMRADLNAVTQKVESREVAAEQSAAQGRILH